MSNTERIQEIPHIIIGPFDDRRNQKRFFTSDTPKCTLSISIYDSHLSVVFRLATSFLGISFFSIDFKTFKVATKLAVVYFHLISFGSTRTLRLADAD